MLTAALTDVSLTFYSGVGKKKRCDKMMTWLIPWFLVKISAEGVSQTWCYLHHASPYLLIKARDPFPTCSLDVRFLENPYRISYNSPLLHDSRLCGIKLWKHSSGGKTYTKRCRLNVDNLNKNNEKKKYYWRGKNCDVFMIHNKWEYILMSGTVS